MFVANMTYKKREYLFLAMKIKIAFVLIILLLGVTSCLAQEFSCRVQVSGVLPLRRTFAVVELRKQIAPRYAISLAGDDAEAECRLGPGSEPRGGLWLGASLAKSQLQRPQLPHLHVGPDVVMAYLRSPLVLRRSFDVLAVIPVPYRPASRHTEIVCGFGL